MAKESIIIGRQVEMAEFRTVFDAVIAGEGKIVLIAGEAGMGKTILAEECLAASGLHIFTGRAIPDTAPPYHPIALALRDALNQLPDNLIAQLKVLQQVQDGLPMLGFATGATTIAGTTFAAELKPERFAGLIIDAFSAIARINPAAIFLEDLQWADNATLEFLPLFIDRLRHERILLLGTYRSDEIHREHRLRWLRNELRRQRRLQEIQLGPLSRSESKRLIQRTLTTTPVATLVDTLFQQTMGVPFFLEELTTALVEQDLLRQTDDGLELIPGKDVPIPASVRDAVLLRLESFSGTARKQLEIAAVCGMEFDLSQVVDLAGEEEGIDELFEKGFIAEKEFGRAGFYHALTREAVRSAIPWSRRRTLNRRIAEYLQRNGGMPEVIGEHLLAANELDGARKMLLTAAERYCHLQAYRDATQTILKTLDIWPDEAEDASRLEVLERLAHCAQMSGQLVEAIKALREAVDNPLLSSDLGRLGRAQRSLAILYNLQGAWEQSLSARVEAAATFEKAGLKNEAATELLAAARRNFGMLNQAIAIDLCEKALALAIQANSFGNQARALAVKGDVLSSMGQSEAGIKTVQKGLSLALKHNLTDAAAEVYRRLGSALEYASQFAASRDAYKMAYNYCQTQGEVNQAQICLSCMTYVLFRTGDWKQCVEICREVINDVTSPPGTHSVALGVEGLIGFYRGETRQARKYIGEALEIARHEKDPAKEMICAWGLAQIEEAEGNTAQAAKTYLQILDMRAVQEDFHDALPMLCAACTFFTKENMEKEVVRTIEALSEMVAITANNEALGALAYALGENALLHDDSEEAARQFVTAAAHFEKVSIPVERLRAITRAGLANKRSGRKEIAVQQFKTAYRLARSLGCRPYMASLIADLKALGAVAEERRNEDAPERAARGGLTSRQLEIARLIAEGLTNKEIANKLFLSPRTVEMHVANLLNRLDCRTRAEAVRKAAEMNLLD